MGAPSYPLATPGEERPSSIACERKTVAPVPSASPTVTIAQKNTFLTMSPPPVCIL